MKEYKVNVKGLDITVFRDEDGKFIVPQEVKELEKIGTQLKPSYEPVIVARKPCEGSCVDNVIKYGVGGINIDECRIGYEIGGTAASNPLLRLKNNYRTPQTSKIENNSFDYVDKRTGFSTSKNEINEEGRFPSNVILSYDDETYDEVCGGLPTNEKAFRVAVFMEKHNGSAYTAVSPETLPAASSIFSESGATYFTSDSAVKTTSSVDSVLTQNNAVSVNVAAGATEYYKVVVRIWLEGEDSTCNNDTFASLTRNWVLDLAFELDTTTPAVTQLGTTAVASTASGAVGTVTLTDGKLSNGESPVTYAWKNADGTAASGTNNAASYTATTSGVYYCAITTVGNTYYTDGMTLTVTP